MQTADDRHARATEEANDGVRRFFRRNATLFVAWEVLWGVGAPCCLGTLVPGYLNLLGAPKTLIQIVAAAGAGLMILQLWSGKLIHGSRRKQRCFWTWIAYCSVWMLYGALAAWAYSTTDRRAWIAAFGLAALASSAVVAAGGPATEELLLQNVPLSLHSLRRLVHALPLRVRRLHGPGRERRARLRPRRARAASLAGPQPFAFWQGDGGEAPGEAGA